MCEDASVLTDMTHDELIDKLMENLMVLFSIPVHSLGKQLSTHQLEFNVVSQCEYCIFI